MKIVVRYTDRDSEEEYQFPDNSAIRYYKDYIFVCEDFSGETLMVINRGVLRNIIVSK